MKNTLLLLAAACALGAGYADEAPAEKASTEVFQNENQSALDELKTQKKVLAEMREGLSDEDRKALEDDFKKKLAEIDQRIAQLEAVDEDANS